MGRIISSASFYAVLALAIAGFGPDAVAQTGTTLADDDCPATPDTGCLAAELSLVSLGGGGEKKKLDWKWKIGDSFSHDDLGDPLSSTEYVFCVYDSIAGSFALVTKLQAPPGSFWIDRDPKGWQYKDSAGSNDGIRKVQIKPGDSGKTSVRVKAKGADVPLPAAVSTDRYFHQDPGVIVQLQKKSGSGPSGCWTSGEFGDSDTSRNDASGFKAKNQ